MPPDVIVLKTFQHLGGQLLEHYDTTLVSLHGERERYQWHVNNIFTWAWSVVSMNYAIHQYQLRPYLGVTPKRVLPPSNRFDMLTCSMQTILVLNEGPTPEPNEELQCQIEFL